jgi:hypothetical protein
MRFHRIFALAAILLWGAPVWAEEVKIPHDGLTLNADLTRASGKTLADGVVLIVHGTLAHNRMETIRNLSDVLVDRGLSTLAINLSLGLDDRHGMYDCKFAHRHRYLDSGREIGAWLNWLKTRGGAQRHPDGPLARRRAGRPVRRRYERGGENPPVAAPRDAAGTGHVERQGRRQDLRTPP